MRKKMDKRLEKHLETGEKVLWKRLPRRGRLRSSLITVQVLGHVMLTFFSVIFSIYISASVAHRVVLGILLVAATNAPLLVWSYYRLPQISGGGDAVFFLTDRRVGLLRPNGEIRQAPICPGLSVKVYPSVVEFSLGERTPVSFGGLKREEVLLVSAVAEGLIEKCQS